MTKPLVAVLLILPIVSTAEDHEMVEKLTTESAALLEQKYCRLAQKIIAKSNSERRFKSMGNHGAASRLGTERLLLAREIDLLREEIKKQKLEVRLSQCYGELP